MTKTFWLSFADDTLPKGKQHLGAAVVDVTDTDVAKIRDEIQTLFPLAQPGAEWLAAATRKSWYLGCNPGGQILAAELSPQAAAGLPRNRMLTQEELQRYGAPLEDRREPETIH